MGEKTVLYGEDVYIVLFTMVPESVIFYKYNFIEIVFRNGNTVLELGESVFEHLTKEIQ